MRRQHTLLPAALIVATAWLASCAREEATAPPLPDVPAPSGDVADQDLIPGQYIVVFDDDVGNPVRLANELAAAHGLTLRHTYQHAIKGFSAKFPEAAEGVILQALQRNPNVSYIEQDAYSYIDTHPRYREIMAARFATGVIAGASAVAPFRPPSNLTATATGENSIDVSWTDQNSDEEGHELERSDTGPNGPFTKIADLGINAENYPDMGLNPSTQYCYRVRAFKPKKGKKGGTQFTDYSNTDCATTFGPPQPPDGDPVTDLAANAQSQSQIDLTWTENTTNEDGWEIWRCTGDAATCDDGGLTNYAMVDQTGPFAGNGSYNDMGLSSDTDYSYLVRAFNGGGFSDYSNEASARTDAPPPPPDGDPVTDLAANAQSQSQIDLTWTENTTNEDGWEIWRCTGDAATCDDGGLTNYAMVDQTGPFAGNGSYNDTGLSSDTDYSYLVRAFNGGGVSAFSNEASARTDAPQPGQCDDNGVHDPTTGPGDYGINASQAKFNNTWLGVRGNDPATCGIKAEFYGLDTGVDSDHPDLNVVEIVDFTGTNGTGEDDHGHGSHTAGTAAAIDGGPAGGVVGMAPGAAIHGFKVCTAGGSCPNSDIIAGVDEVTARKNAGPTQPMVANMSLGGGISNSIDTAVRRSVNAGVTYALSAGNGVFGACFFPADAQGSSPARTGDDDINASDGSNGDTKRVNGVLTTTSHNSSFNDVNCNYGNPVTIAAPGSGIRSTWLNGGYNTISGTSMAAPHSAGAAMLYLQDGTDDPTTVEDALCQRTLPWSTNDLPNAEGRLNVDGLGTDPADAPNQPTATSTCS